MKKCSASFAVRETQIKARMRRRFMPMRLAVRESQQLLGSTWRDQNSHTMLVQTECSRHFGEQSGNSHRYKLLLDAAMLLLGIYSGKLETSVRAKICT